MRTKIYNKRDDFDFDIVNFPFLDGDVPRSASYGVYISQLIRFARVSSHVDDFNTRNKVLVSSKSPLSSFFSFFLARLIVVMSACLVCNSSIVATCPPIPAARFAFRLYCIRFVFLEARARVGRPQTSSSPPVIFIAGRPKAALLFWFFGDFRCGALLFMVIHVIYKYENK